MEAASGAISEVPTTTTTTTQDHVAPFDEILKDQNRAQNMAPSFPPVPAVRVRGAKKSYKTQKGTTLVLDGINMTVQAGTIYTLLGSSGCGKTTLLSCVVGLRDLDQGEIRLFGHKPGSRRAGVPGRAVGFMPQELALYQELTIHQLLLYYGRLFGMLEKGVEEVMKFLVTFLRLPPPHRRVGTLSGGQQRRVSFAVALLNSPRLLILDEPTVGVDPLLRRSIWNHLIKLVSTGETTVIITTHYVEEARQSSSIGLMRHGRLLSEDSPTALLSRYQTNLLEDIVLQLCLKESQERKEHGSSSLTKSVGENVGTSGEAHKRRHRGPGVDAAEDASSRKYYLAETARGGNDVSNVELKSIRATKEQDDDEINAYKQRHQSMEILNAARKISKGEEELKDFQRITMELRRQSSTADRGNISETWRELATENYQKVRAITLRNMSVIFTNYLLVLILILAPAAQIIVICVCVGRINRLEFGVVNLDSKDPFNCTASPGCSTAGDWEGRLSCTFLNILQQQDAFRLNVFESEEIAVEQVKLTNIWGYFLFQRNYTESMKERAILGLHADNQSYYDSRIQFTLDDSNLMLSRDATVGFLQAFKKYVYVLGSDCGADPIFSQPPIYHEDPPIFGHSSVSVRESWAPNTLVALLFMFPMAISSILYIMEKKSGTLSRSLVAGVTVFEMMTASLVLQLGILCAQSLISLLIIEWGFGIPIVGPFHCALALTVLTGVTGMSVGFLLAVLLEDGTVAVLTCLGIFIPNLMLSGLLWSLEGLPDYLLWFSNFLPCTWGGSSLRSVVSRGLSYSHSSVYSGFLALSAWNVALWSINICIQRYRSKG